MTAKAELVPKQPPAEPDFSKFADRDFTEGVAIDEDQEWIKNELARRLHLIDSGQAKFITLKELDERFEKLRRERTPHS